MVVGSLWLQGFQWGFSYFFITFYKNFHRGAVFKETGFFLLKGGRGGEGGRGHSEAGEPRCSAGAQAALFVGVRAEARWGLQPIHVDTRGAAVSARGLAGDNLVGKAPKNSLGLCTFTSPRVLQRP